MPENNSMKNKIISFAALALALGTVVYANTLAAFDNAPQVQSVAPNPVIIAQPNVQQTVPSTDKPAASSITHTPTQTPVKNPTQVVVEDPVIIPKSKYKDGTYTASSSYAVPEGSEQITVTLTITNDIVVDATVVNDASRGDSRKYQSRFQSGYKAQVVGKNIDDIQLSRVSGSSLTPRGFNAALTKIKTQAVA